MQYADGEVSWFQRIVDKELWLYRSSDAGDQELSSIIDRRKWKRRKISVEESSRRSVIAFYFSIMRVLTLLQIFHEVHRIVKVSYDTAVLLL